MATIFHTTFPNAFLWIEIIVFDTNLTQMLFRAQVTKILTELFQV